jgi:hypothetical protein
MVPPVERRGQGISIVQLGSLVQVSWYRSPIRVFFENRVPAFSSGVEFSIELFQHFRDVLRFSAERPRGFANLAHDILLR